jgi:hypothetical protein
MSIKFNVLNRWSDEIQFTAEIDCDEDALPSIKIGLSVKWAIKSNASLRGADLRGADLGGADLRGAYLGGADLGGADLRGADLRGAYLGGADLRGADLRGAYLRGAYLGGADLRGAYLRGAYLGGADLGGRKIKDAVTLGYPDRWSALTYVTEEGEQRIIVGCRDKTLAEGRAYWAGKDNRREVLAVIDYAEAIGRIREWNRKDKETVGD